MLARCFLRALPFSPHSFLMSVNLSRTIVSPGTSIRRSSFATIRSQFSLNRLCLPDNSLRCLLADAVPFDCNFDLSERSFLSCSFHFGLPRNLLFDATTGCRIHLSIPVTLPVLSGFSGVAFSKTNRKNNFTSRFIPISPA